MSEDQVHSESPKNRGQSPKLRNEHSWVQWCTPTIAVLARWRQEDQKFKVNLGYTRVLSPVWDTIRPYLKRIVCSKH